MKRIGYLYEKICDPDNIKLAVKNSSKNKSQNFKKHNKQYLDIMKNKDLYIEKLSNLLKTQTFKFSEPRTKTIREREKIRELKIPRYYPDQIVQWAIMQILKPYLLKGLDLHSYSAINKRGCQKCIKDLRKFETKHKKEKMFILKMDIYHYFQNVDIEIMKEKLQRKFKDKKLLNLLSDLLECGGPNLPIGFYSSQLLSNFYLQDFDHFLREKLNNKTISYYCRYMDDIVIYSKNKRKLHKLQKSINLYLKKNYKLKIKENWILFKKYSRPLDFCGYRVYENFIKLRKHIFYSLCNCVKAIQVRGRSLTQCFRYFSYLGYAKHAQMKNFYKNNITNIAPKKYIKIKISQYSRKMNAANY